MPDLEFTGERVIPGLVDPNLLNEHVARYRFAALFAGNAHVLDAGCGTGYGSAEFTSAASITAMDISAEAVVHARQAYGRPRTVFLQGRCETLPFADASFDLVVAFEVIEHLEQWRQLLTESRRVLRPSGVLLVSTPNKAWYAESRAAAGPNPYHVHEFEYREFERALQAEFANVHLWTQNHSEVMAFVPAADSCGTLDAPADAAPENAHFFLAACSQSPIASTSAFGWLPSSGNVLRERQQHIALLEGEIAKKDVWLSEAHTAQRTLQQEFDKLEAELKERTAWGEQQDRELEQARGVIAELRAEISATRAGYEDQIARAEAEAASRLQWVGTLEEQIARGNAQIAHVHAEIAHERAVIDSKDRLIDERTEWAQSLDRQINAEREVYRQLEQQHIQTQEELARTQAQLAATTATNWVRLGRRLNLVPPTLGKANG